MGDWGAGSTPSRKDSTLYGGDIVWLKSGELNGSVVLESEEYVTEEALKRSSLRLNSPGDVLIAMYGATIGKTAIAGIECTTNQAVCACTSFKGVNNEYLHLLLKAYKPYFIGQGIGGAQPNISRQKLISTAVPLPPLEEQARIAAKVDELMALCDKLEEQQQQKRQLQNLLRQATLQAVAAATSPFELKQHWQRLQENFEQLFSAPEDVKELQALILELAASGLLADPESGDSKVLGYLSTIKNAQKEVLTKREEKELQKLSQFEVALQNRVNVALGHLVKIVSGQHLKPEEYSASKIGVPYITGPAEFNMGLPSPTKWTETKRAIAKSGDILITVKGSGVGKTAMCDLEELAISRQLMAIRPLGNLNNEFVHLCIDAAEANFQEQKMGIAIPGIGRDDVLSLPVSLPSPEEQKRIVDRVNKLTGCCDYLARYLRKENILATQLATASISTLTGINTPNKEEPLKVPKTELVAPVTLGLNKPNSKDAAPLAALLARHTGQMNANDLWQRFGGEIDVFYAQLKTEVAHGWLAEPAEAKMLEK